MNQSFYQSQKVAKIFSMEQGVVYVRQVTRKWSFGDMMRTKKEGIHFYDISQVNTLQIYDASE